jgi:hypothetical protein
MHRARTHAISHSAVRSCVVRLERASPSQDREGWDPCKWKSEMPEGSSVWILRSGWWMVKNAENLREMRNLVDVGISAFWNAVVVFEKTVAILRTASNQLLQNRI